jgi:hypothetical protein
VKSNKLPLFIVLGLVAVLAASCTMPFAPAAGDVSEDRAAVIAPNALKVTVTTDKTVYRPGEIVKMNITLTNTGWRPVTLDFMTSQRFDFIVSNVYVPTWKWSSGKVFLPRVGRETVLPGKTLTYVVAEYVARLPSEGSVAPDGVTLSLSGKVISAPAYSGTTQFKVSRYIPL